MSLLEVFDVRKSFAPGTPAVDDISFAINDGEILCLLGPSGCGKTTLLRLIAGLETADAGTIHFDGRDMAGIAPHLRDFGMMFQDFALFPHKNVRDNIAFGLRMHHRPPAEIASRTAEMLDLVNLSQFAERNVASLSGGEQQRVALARALAPSPRLLMLDEPLGALDRALRERLMIDVRTILKRIGMTAVYVTHDQTEAFAVGDRLAVMNAGRFEQIGTPQAVYRHPETPFVAGFLGYQNLIPGRVNEAGEVETAVGRFLPAGKLPPAGSAVTLLIRPTIEQIEEVAAGRAELNRIDGMVDGLTFRGRFSQLWFKTGDRQLLFEVDDGFPFRRGDVIRIAFAPDRLHVYESLPRDSANSRN